MKTENLNYDLPPALIAQHPAPTRTDSKLLVLNRQNNALTDTHFKNIADFLLPSDCLVLNDTKVLPARFFAIRTTGAKLEGLFLNETTPGLWQVYLKGIRKIKPTETIQLKYRETEDFYNAQLIEKLTEGKCLLKITTNDPAEAILENIGFPPLPPYIKRSADPFQAEIDKKRYQTTYANKPGAIAAPTAGLHFTPTLIKKLKNKGISFAKITLHTGAGTFKPVTAANLKDHQIHEEKFIIDQENAQIINNAKDANNRIIAVGTTAVRTLETAAKNHHIQPTEATTKLFITPGYNFQIIDAIITNFHLPKSTLIALVAAFAGLEKTLNAYQHAIEHRYRFYSYGDAMLII